MKKLIEEFEKSLKKMKEDYDASITILQINLFDTSKFSNDMVQQNEEIHELLLTMKKKLLNKKN